MKKLFAVAMAVAAISFMSCGSKTGKAVCEDSCAHKCETCVNAQKCDTCVDCANCPKCDTVECASACGKCVADTVQCASAEKCNGCPKKGE